MRDRHRPGELPWGWWLRATSEMLEDEHGRQWHSVREAFWVGELGFPAVRVAEEQHELMLRVLSSIEGVRSGHGEGMYDLFGGDMVASRLYHCWLWSVGMLDKSDRFGGEANPFEARLSAEGRSVLLMLRATREPAWEEFPFADVIDAVIASERGTAGVVREDALRTFEEGVGFRRHAFARERVGKSHMITLTGLATGAGARMPTRRVTWSMAFIDVGTRDDLFAWLAVRIDRWDDWGQMAYDKGADAFGQHLLGLIVASRSTASSSSAGNAP